MIPAQQVISSQSCLWFRCVCSVVLLKLYEWYPFSAIDTETIHAAIMRTGDTALMKFADTDVGCERFLRYEESEGESIYATARRVCRGAVGLPKHQLAIRLLRKLDFLRTCVYVAARRTLEDQLARVVADLVHSCTLFGL